MHTGAMEGSDRATPQIRALASPMPPGMLLDRGDAVAHAGRWRRPPRCRSVCVEASHIAFSICWRPGTPKLRYPRCPTPDAWPRDALVLGTTVFTNGLIGSSGRVGQKRATGPSGTGWP
jgi:hypothetical protein